MAVEAAAAKDAEDMPLARRVEAMKARKAQAAQEAHEAKAEKERPDRAAEAPADDARLASDNQPRLAEIKACIEDLIQTADHNVLTVKGVRAHVLQKIDAEAGRDYDKSWLKAQVDEIMAAHRTSCAGGPSGTHAMASQEASSPSPPPAAGEGATQTPPLPPVSLTPQAAAAEAVPAAAACQLRCAILRS